MVQVVVLQSIIWYPFLLFLFEYRAGKLLINQQFPDTAGSIASIKVDSDVVSLDGGGDVVETEAEVKDDGNLHVTVRRSQRFCSSNLTDAEIYSLHSSRNQTPGSSFNHADFYTLSARSFNLGTSDVFGAPLGKSNIMSVVSPVVERENGDDKDLHLFVWNSGTSQVAVTPCKARVDGLRLEEEHELEETTIKEEKANAKPPTSVMTKLILVMVWRKLIRNPNTYSSLIGLIWSLISYRYHVKMPMIITKSISIMSDTGLGMAMFGLGLFMAMQPRLIVCGKRIAASTMAVRFLVGPAIMAAASLAVGIRGALLHVAIVQAALPLGIVPFVFAKEYGVHPDILSTGVIFGMLVALPVTLIYYIALDA